MMHPTNFDESNHMLSRPPGTTDEECGPLCVFVGEQPIGHGNTAPIVISCWKPTKEELKEINRTGRVWLGIWGETMPPAWVSGTKPFE